MFEDVESEFVFQGFLGCTLWLCAFGFRESLKEPREERSVHIGLG